MCEWVVRSNWLVRMRDKAPKGRTIQHCRERECTAFSPAYLGLLSMQAKTTLICAQHCNWRVVVHFLFVVVIVVVSCCVHAAILSQFYVFVFYY